MASTSVLKRAAFYAEKIRARDAAWEADADYSARQGYRPHYCRHGVNLWTEFDPICGPCEDSLSLYEEALMWAKADYAEATARIEKVAPILPDLGHDHPLWSPLLKWAWEPMGV